MCKTKHLAKQSVFINICQKWAVHWRVVIFPILDIPQSSVKGFITNNAQSHQCPAVSIPVADLLWLLHKHKMCSLGASLYGFSWSSSSYRCNVYIAPYFCSDCIFMPLSCSQNILQPVKAYGAPQSFHDPRFWSNVLCFWTFYHSF